MVFHSKAMRKTICQPNLWTTKKREKAGYSFQMVTDYASEQENML